MRGNGRRSPRRADGATFFQFALRYYGQSQNRQRPAPGTVNMWDEYNKWKRENPEAQEAALRGGLIGSPETIRKKLRRFRTSHIDQVILLNQAGKNSHEHICELLELFAKEVMPEFQHDPEHEAWKAGVMSGAIQLEEIDTEAFKDRYGKLAVSVAPTRKSRRDSGFGGRNAAGGHPMPARSFVSMRSPQFDPAAAAVKLRSTALLTSSVLERMP